MRNLYARYLYGEVMRHKKKWIKFGVFHKISLIMITVTLAPTLLIWSIQYQGITNRITNHVDQYLGEVLARLTTYVDGWVEMNSRMLHYTARLPAMQSMIPEEQNPLLHEIVNAYPWNYLAFTIDLEGQNVGRSDGNPTLYYGDRAYVRQVLGGQSLVKQVVIGRTSLKPALIVAVPMQGDDRELMGILAIAMTIGDLSEHIVNVRIGETGFAFLVDEEGKVIAHPSEEMANARHDLQEHPAVRAGLAGRTSVTYQEEDGGEVIAYMARTAKGWILVVQQERSEAFSELTQANRQALLLLLVTIGMVLLIALGVSRSIAAPIRRLTEISNELSRGKMDSTITDRERNDEIGELARSIGRLGNSTRLAMDRLQKIRDR